MATPVLTEDQWALKRLSAQSMRLLRKKADLRARTLKAMQAEQVNDTAIADIEARQRALVSKIAGETQTDRPLAGLQQAPVVTAEQAVAEMAAERERLILVISNEATSDAERTDAQMRVRAIEDVLYPNS